MPIIRLTIILVFIASLVLIALYLVSRQQKYLNLLKQLLKYTGWMLVTVLLLYLITRVIRL
ncbi:MAG: hypothetical protein CTY37_03110 [Methylotenera sp.]|nr:MAG: hypothetical protein BVN34_00250 [Proteobacteria bacterium ST_bin12]PPC87634.1 MAG: hypothetical protein CTY37_03110 [Methylotenera sp.]PPD18172.1 MAG: hypothetical protein CTY27_02290 [Methylotenera sp.]PPD51854.1 MAG: hypothetical protein CTY10_10060 [Methylotenera sp.]